MRRWLPLLILLATPVLGQAVPAWDTDPDDNSATPPLGAPENMLPGEVNDTIRANMAAVRRLYETQSGEVTTTGTGNTFQLTFVEQFTEQPTGRVFAFTAHQANTAGGTLLRINSLAAVAVVDIGGSALPADVFSAGSVHRVYHDGTNYVLYYSAVNTLTPASETAAGIVELATDAEVQAGTDTERAVTPAGITSLTDILIATGDRRGLIELATDAEVQTGTDTERAVTPAGLVSLTATEERSGIVELATDTEVDTGTDTGRVPTVAGLRRATGPRVSSAEITAGTSTEIRRFAPVDVQTMAEAAGQLTAVSTLPASPATNDAIVYIGTTFRELSAWSVVRGSLTLANPTGMTVDSDGDYVISAATSLTVYDDDSASSTITGPTGITVITGVATDDDGDFVICGTATIDSVLTHNAVYVRTDGTWGSAITGPTTTSGSEGIAVLPNGDYIMLWSGTPDRIYTYDGSSWDDGLQYNLPGKVSTPADIAVNNNGDIMVIGSLSGTPSRGILTYDGESWDSGVTIPSSETNPDGIAVESDDSIVIFGDVTNTIYRAAYTDATAPSSRGLAYWDGDRWRNL